jgi:hypothetical protein
MPEASLPAIDHFPAFLARLPSHVDLESLARETGSFQRPRGVRTATDLLRLALAWGPGGYSMQRVVAWAGERQIASLTEDPRRAGTGEYRASPMAPASESRAARERTGGSTAFTTWPVGGSPILN